MKFLALALLLAVKSYATVAAGTQALSFTTPGDLTKDAGPNGYTLTQTGTVPQNVTACTTAGISAGPFSDSNYFTAPAALMTAMNNQPQGSVQWYMLYYTASITQPVPWDSNGLTTFFQIVTGNFPDFAYAFPSRLTSSNAVAPNTCYHFAVEWDSTNISIYKNGVLDKTGAISTKPAFNTTLQIGRYSGGTLPLDGYISQLRFSTIAYHLYPTVDSGGDDNCIPMPGGPPCD